MKKIFPLTSPNHQPARVVEQIKSDVRKYVKRERKKALPEGVDFWDFDCKFGATQEAAAPVHLAEITGLIDGVVAESGKQFYIEILAKHGHRQARPEGEAGEKRSRREAAVNDLDDLEG